MKTLLRLLRFGLALLPAVISEVILLERYPDWIRAHQGQAIPILLMVFLIAFVGCWILLPRIIRPLNI